MARRPRCFLDGQVHHVIQRGNNRTVLFVGEHDYQFMVTCLKRACTVHGVAIHAYALMKTHIHLLVTPSSATSLPRLMQSVGVRLAAYVNHRRHRTGALFEGRYRDALVNSEQYFVACMRYIENNPVRAGVVRRPGYFPWSSYRANALGRDDELVTPHPIYNSMGRTPEARTAHYKALFRVPLSDDVVEAIRDNTNGAWVLGEADFRAWVEAKTGQRTAPRFSRGRLVAPGSRG
jgi:putative transposase